MNDNPLTHNPMKQDGSTGRRKIWMVTAAVILAVIAIAGIAYSVYAWQQNQKLSDDVTAKNKQIADLQKQETSSSSSTSSEGSTSTTQQSDPYAGWQSATLKYEKISLKYPSTWKLTNVSTPYGTNNVMTSPGIDVATLTSPTGLMITISTGAHDVSSPYSSTPQYTTPIATLGGNYYLGFGAGPAGDTYPVFGGIGTSLDGSITYPPSRNVTVSRDQAYNAIHMSYAPNGTANPLSTYLNDPSYNDALLILKSLSY